MIELEYSYWLVPVCILLAALISLILYTKKAPWNDTVNKVLMVVRFTLSFLLLFLMLNPLLKQFINITEKPKFIFSFDNSSSMARVTSVQELDSARSFLSTLERKLLDKGYSVDKLVGIEPVKNFDSLKFDLESSDLTGWVSDALSKYENQNIAGMVMVSDGNFNSGIAPSFASFNLPVHTLGVGDTTQKKDVELLDVKFNKIVYQGNRFPLLIDIVNHGFERGDNAIVSVYQDGQRIASKELILENGLSQISFDLDANEEGVQKYIVKVEPVQGEEIVENNERSIYFDVIDGKQKIAIIASAPHPDLKVIKTVIEKNKNYEVDVIVSGVSKLDNSKYDLAIVHTPSDRFNRTAKITSALNNDKVPIMYVLGVSSIARNFSKVEQSLPLVQLGNQRDNVTGAFNSDFNLFSIPSTVDERLRQFIPLSVPYGEIKLRKTSQVLLYQQVGNIVTDKPLLYVDEFNGRKVAVWMADGIWQWRQQEFAIYDNADVVDALITNLVKYMSTKTDKRQFRFYPKKNEYTTQDKIVFETEIYNQVYERVYDTEVEVKLIDAQGDNKSYTFVPSSDYSILEIADLQEGIYQYEASAKVGAKKEIVRGTLVVKELQLEQMNQKANYEVLEKMANNSQGRFFTLGESEELIDYLNETHHSGVLHQEEQNISVINIYWILMILVLIVSAEWFIRKYNGGY